MRKIIKISEWHYNGDRLFGTLEDGSKHVSSYVEAIPGEPEEGDVAVTHDARYILGKPMMEVRPRASGREGSTGAWIWIGGMAVAGFIILFITYLATR